MSILIITLNAMQNQIPLHGARPKVGIVGAGMAGLRVAGILVNGGWDVTVFGTGSSKQLHPKTWTMKKKNNCCKLDKIGVAMLARRSKPRV